MVCHLIFHISIFRCDFIYVYSQYFEDESKDGILQFFEETIVFTFQLYLFCHFGNHVTERIDDIHFAAYNICWYELPLDMQKIIAVIIRSAQKPVYIRVFGGAHCSREVFMKVPINSNP